MPPRPSATGTACVPAISQPREGAEGFRCTLNVRSTAPPRSRILLQNSDFRANTKLGGNGNQVRGLRF
jgi:hypothetical protein